MTGQIRHLRDYPNNERINEANAIASELNTYLTSIAEVLNVNNSHGSTLNTDKIGQFIDSKVPGHIQFNLPFINTEPVKSYINKLELSKATEIDGLGPRIIKLAIDSLSPSIAQQTMNSTNVLKLVYFSLN